MIPPLLAVLHNLVQSFMKTATTLLFHKQDSLDKLFSYWLHFTTVSRTEIGKLVRKLSLTRYYHPSNFVFLAC